MWTVRVSHCTDPCFVCTVLVKHRNTSHTHTHSHTLHRSSCEATACLTSRPHSLTEGGGGTSMTCESRTSCLMLAEHLFLLILDLVHQLKGFILTSTLPLDTRRCEKDLPCAIHHISMHTGEAKAALTDGSQTGSSLF